MTSIRKKPEGDFLLAYCWCGRMSDYIPGEAVRKGTTFKCSSACWTYYRLRGPKFPDTFKAEPETATE